MIWIKRRNHDKVHYRKVLHQRSGSGLDMPPELALEKPNTTDGELAEW
ncbi:hypothetical protein MUY21_01500 [Aliiroseovarius sp. S2029]|nr:hypothetical protein [Aliiroseovarius sp. S2029]